MNESKGYSKYALCREMLATPGIIRGFDAAAAEAIPVGSDRILLSGEGSSRIFPAKRLMAQAMREGWKECFVTEGARQAGEYKLEGYHLFVASNSGKTAEGVRLLLDGTPAGSTGIVANGGTPIAERADSSFVLGCGPEEAVAATKSVVEEALVFDVLFRRRNGAPAVDLVRLAELFDEALRVVIPPDIVRGAVAAPGLYFAGRNDGVAEELTLKSDEVARKRADFLEGTYAVHGIEEIMQPDELVVLVDPFPDQEEKFRTVLAEGVGMKVVAIADRDTAFPTIRIPSAGDLAPYVQLAAGWNLLVEIGLVAGVNIDKPHRARKVGNEFIG
ncbi:MAG: sugar isomerase [Alkalispirochaeta sp.]|jgi:glucosamine--fructose-6-phosphate aminotransferase (isomerizing)